TARRWRRCCWPLLLVSLHLRHRTDLGGVRVLPVLPPRPALTEQVPALVKRLFSRTKAVSLLFRAELAARELPPELVLGVDQVGDPGHDVLVVHVHKVCRRLPRVRSGIPVTPNGGVAAPAPRMTLPAPVSRGSQALAGRRVTRNSVTQ